VNQVATVKKRYDRDNTGLPPIGSATNPLPWGLINSASCRNHGGSLSSPINTKRGFILGN